MLPHPKPTPLPLPAPVRPAGPMPGPPGMRGDPRMGRQPSGRRGGAEADQWERGKPLPPMPGMQFDGRRGGPPPGMRMPSGPIPQLHKTESAYKVGGGGDRLSPGSSHSAAPHVAVADCLPLPSLPCCPPRPAYLWCTLCPPSDSMRTHPQTHSTPTPTHIHAPPYTPAGGRHPHRRPCGGAGAEAAQVAAQQDHQGQLCKDHRPGGAPRARTLAGAVAHSKRCCPAHLLRTLGSPVPSPWHQPCLLPTP